MNLYIFGTACYVMMLCAVMIGIFGWFFSTDYYDKFFENDEKDAIGGLIMVLILYVIDYLVLEYTEYTWVHVVGMYISSIVFIFLFGICVFSVREYIRRKRGKE